MKTITIDSKEWQLVPVEPTMRQVLAGQLGITTSCAIAVYHAMLSNAPEAPAQDTKDAALRLARDALDDLENYVVGFSVSGVYLADEIEGSRLLAKACDAITEIDNVIKGN